MYRHSLLFITIAILSNTLSAQYYRISGRVSNNRLEPLALASVQIKGQASGVITREDGTYSLRLEEGVYELVVSMVGFQSQVFTVALNKNITQNVILEPTDKGLSEVIVKGKLRDRSEEIIRRVIAQKEQILSASGPYSCRAYIRAIQEDSTIKRSKKKKPITDTSRTAQQNADLQRMSMAEISLRYDHETDRRVKEERLGVVTRGNPESLYYLSLTEGNFNLYRNLLESRILSDVPFLSPVSYGGLAAYRYRMVGIQQAGNQKIYTISVRPRQLSNVTIEGEIRILDSAWVILSANFSLPNYHVPEYDRFEVGQQYGLVDGKAWMITRQNFRYYSKTGKGKLSGETIVTYSDFELNKIFPPKYFGMEVSSTAQEAYERDSSFWEKSRTEPLTEKEVRFIRYKDSIYHATHTRAYLDSIDRRVNKVTWKKIAFAGQTLYSREKERTWDLPSLLQFYQPLSFGGTRINPTVWHHKIYKSKKTLTVFANVSYGIRNKDVNGSFSLTKMYNPFNRGFYRISGGREFQAIFSGDAWINQIKRSNVYLNNSLGVGHGLELANGLFLYTDFDIAFRRSVSDYKTNPQVDSLLGDWLKDNEAIDFKSYNAVYGKVRLQYTPAQRYIREPREKVILGSAWPTFYTLYRKGIPGVFRSTINFDYLEFGIEQELKLGVTGISKYVIKTGIFLTRKDLRLVDYQFQRRGDPLLFLNPNEQFQMLDSTFPVFKRYYQAHLVHEFNGAIINKIPFLKKLELREVAGGGFLYAPERNLRYAELFAGIERVFKVPFFPLIKFKLGGYVVGSAANQFRNPVQFKIGITTWDRKLNKWL